MLDAPGGNSKNITANCRGTNVESWWRSKKNLTGEETQLFRGRGKKRIREIGGETD